MTPAFSQAPQYRIRDNPASVRERGINTHACTCSAARIPRIRHTAITAKCSPISGSASHNNPSHRNQTSTLPAARAANACAEDAHIVQRLGAEALIFAVGMRQQSRAAGLFLAHAMNIRLVEAFLNGEIQDVGDFLDIYLSTTKQLAGF